MTDKRDVVLVTVDSFRSDRCGFLGSDAGLTPAMDRLAGDGLVFENAVAPAGATSGSSSTFFTGRYPIERSTASDRKEVMRQNLKAGRTLPQRFKDMGYRTAGFTANPWTSRFFGYDAGFDEFEDFMEDDLTSDTIEQGTDRGGAISGLASQVVNWWQGQDMYMSWDAYYDQITDWLDEARQGDEPFFLWIFLVDVHMPYFPPDGYRSRSRLLTYPANTSLFTGQYDLPFESLFHDVLVDSYDDSIRYTDEFIGRLTDDADGDPLIAITGDHGEAFGENGVYGHGPEVSEEMLHVPFVVANGPEGTVERPFSLRNLPEFLPALATGEPVDDLTEATTWSRNYDPAVLIRGQNWRFEWRPGSQQVHVREDGEWNERSVPELELLGRELLETHVESERERGRVLDAADAVTARAPL